MSPKDCVDFFFFFSLYAVYFLPQPRILCVCWRSHIRSGWLPASSVLSEKIPFMQRSQSCYWSLWEFQVWNVLAIISVLHNLTWISLTVWPTDLHHRWGSWTRWGLLYILFYISFLKSLFFDTLYPSSPKKGPDNTWMWFAVVNKSAKTIVFPI